MFRRKEKYHMWIFDDANPLEIFWTIYNLLGAGLAIGLCIDLLKDARDKIIMAERSRKEATYLSLSFAAVFILSMVLHVIIGLVSMTQPQLNPNSISPAQYVAAYGFILVATMEIIVLAFWRLLRHRFRRAGIDPNLAVGKASAT
jgi:protein-S-isoprenylcysteine O-methyltransferase Ste14